MSCNGENENENINSNLVPAADNTIFQSVNNIVKNEDMSAMIMSHPAELNRISKTETSKNRMLRTKEKNMSQDEQAEKTEQNEQTGLREQTKPNEQNEQAEPDPDENIADRVSAGEISDDSSAGLIEIKAADDIGRATALDVKEALHQVIDPELRIDVIDLGLVYGVEIDEKGRAIITMTLTTPACPLTDLIEDECASVLSGLVEEFRVDWTWTPPWTTDMISEEGREQLAALGFNLSSLPNNFGSNSLGI